MVRGMHWCSVMTTDASMRALRWLAALALLSGCNKAHDSSHAPSPDACAQPPCQAKQGPAPAIAPEPKVDRGPGAAVALNTAALQSELEQQRSALSANAALDTDALLAKRAVSHEDALPYDPMSAQRLDLIQKSSVALEPAELEQLGRQGFAISKRKEFPTFGYGYVALYAEDLPLYVSLDSVLEAVHRSYDEMLMRIEAQALVAELGKLLSGMRDNLRMHPPAGMSEQSQRDAELYLAIAHRLLDPAAEPAGLGADQSRVDALVAKAEAATGSETVELFGTTREEDFSQFKPRAHYIASPQLSRYFRAMMWLGRVDFRMLESDDDGKLIFRRPQLEAAVGLALLVDETQLAHFEAIDFVIGAFTGESDSMRVQDVPRLLTALGVPDLQGLAALPDDAIAQAIVDGGFGAQRIASSIVLAGPRTAALPLARSFLLFGQRYTVDAHVLSNLVFDRLQVQGAPPRLMPDSLDVAYAALGNDDALPLLRDQFDQYHHAPQLEDMRDLTDAHGDDYWNANLYGVWMSALRAASAAPARAADPGAALPAVMRTEAWGRRMLNTQLASWAELRHDTVLYAKQSYTGGFACEFPDAYVDPYPQAWAALEAFARKGQDLNDGLLALGLPTLLPREENYFTKLEAAMRTLREMASAEIAGTPFTAEQMAFIQTTIRRQTICGSKAVTGWYGDLYFNPERAGEDDPVIADVHTQPTDEQGTPVGRILHVGVGRPRLMVVTANTCTGPRAYAGLVSSYFEYITSDYRRLADKDWSTMVNNHEPRDVPWMAPVLDAPTQP